MDAFDRDASDGAKGRHKLRRVGSGRVGSARFDSARLSDVSTNDDAATDSIVCRLSARVLLLLRLLACHVSNFCFPCFFIAGLCTCCCQSIAFLFLLAAPFQLGLHAVSHALVSAASRIRRIYLFVCTLEALQHSRLTAVRHAISFQNNPIFATKLA